MKKLVLLSVSIALSVVATAQVYITTTAKVEFFSEAPLENITAVNSTTSSLINTTSDSVFVRIKNTAFVFKNALMQEHFNENYMESSKYPVASFKGKINDDIDYTKEGTYPVTATGKMNIHGVDKTEKIKGTLTVKNGIIHLESKLMVRTGDYKIEIPKLLFEKIAEEIKVILIADYKLKK